MNLSKVEESPVHSLDYLERYVNDGSPSGFTTAGQFSDLTDPFGKSKSFFLDRVVLENENETEVFGDKSFLPSRNLLIHPDMKKSLTDKGFRVEKSEIQVVPTSSGRTCRLLHSDTLTYIKLHYEGVVGRVVRALPFKKAIAGIEVSRELEVAIGLNDLPQSMAIMRELSVVRLYEPESKTDVCAIWRDGSPFGPRTSSVRYLIPAFSLWSNDQRSSRDACLLQQILERSNQQNLAEAICQSVIDCYFTMILKHGFQIELNAQNILFGFDRDWSFVTSVIRDFSGVEKDATIRSLLGLSSDFLSAPYKVISNDDLELWQIRHSFAFDFKLCQYVIAPMLDCSSKFGIKVESILERLIRLVDSYIGQLPRAYFPKSCWYSHPKMLLTKERPYVRESNPYLR